MRRFSYRAVLAVLALATRCLRGEITFTVNTVLDAPDVALDGVCATPARTCSLRAAIQEANAASVASHITVPSGTYSLVVPGVGGAEVGDLDVIKTMAIEGAGAGKTIIDADSLGDRIFNVTANVGFFLSGVTMKNGSASGDGYGGCVRHVDGYLEVSHSVLSGCGAANGGGGIYSISTNGFSATDTTFEFNFTNGPGGGALFGGPGTFDVARCLFHENVASDLAGEGGAVAVAGAAFVNVVNTTFDTNHTTHGGGAVGWTAASTAFVKLYNVTVVGNNAATGGAFYKTGGFLYVRNSVFTGNVDDAGGSDCIGTFNSYVYNRFAAPAASCNPLVVEGSVAYGSVTLGPLQDNGGEMMTRALPVGSPLLDVSPADACVAPDNSPLTNDQRGVKRPLFGGCDAGAFEREPVGDANADGLVDLTDVFYIINYLFASGAKPLGRANVNGDDSVTVGDVFYLINYLYASGPAPV